MPQMAQAVLVLLRLLLLLKVSLMHTLNLQVVGVILQTKPAGLTVARQTMILPRLQYLLVIMLLPIRSLYRLERVKQALR